MKPNKIFFLNLLFLILFTGYCYTQSNSEWYLINEIREGNLKKVRSYIESGLNINFKNEIWGTPLGCACEKDRYEIAKLLLEKGANPNEESKYGKYPIEYAAENNNLNIINLLIDYNVELNDCNGYNALSSACLNNNKKIINVLLTNGVNPEIHCVFVRPALISSIIRKNLEIVKKLINMGADINIVYKGDTPLNYAVSKESVEIVNYLIEKGADVNLCLPIIEAAKTGNTKIFNILLNKGANIHVRDKYHRTVMHYAQKADEWKLKILLKKLGFKEIKGLYDKNRIEYYTEYYNQNKTDEALALLREEIIDPSNSIDQNQAALRNHGLLLLKKYSEQYGITDEILEEAKDYYEDGIYYANTQFKDLKKHLKLAKRLTTSGGKYYVINQLPLFMMILGNLIILKYI